MSQYGTTNVVVQFDNSSNSLQTITQYVQEVGGIKVKADTEDGHSFGDSYAEALDTGFRRMDDITVKGFYDDTAAGGPDALFWSNGAAIGNTRTLKLTYGSTKTTSIETVIAEYTRMPLLEKLTKYEAVLRPTGAPTET